MVPKALSGYYNINQADFDEEKLEAYSQALMPAINEIIRPIDALNLEREIQLRFFVKRWARDSTANGNGPLRFSQDSEDF